MEEPPGSRLFVVCGKSAEVGGGLRRAGTPRVRMSASVGS